VANTRRRENTSAVRAGSGVTRCYSAARQCASARCGMRQVRNRGRRASPVERRRVASQPPACRFTCGAYVPVKCLLRATSSRMLPRGAALSLRAVRCCLRQARVLKRYAMLFIHARYTPLRRVCSMFRRFTAAHAARRAARYAALPPRTGSTAVCCRVAYGRSRIYAPRMRARVVVTLFGVLEKVLEEPDRKVGGSEGVPQPIQW